MVNRATRYYRLRGFESHRRPVLEFERWRKNMIETKILDFIAG